MSKKHQDVPKSQGDFFLEKIKGKKPVKENREQREDYQGARKSRISFKKYLEEVNHEFLEDELEELLDEAFNPDEPNKESNDVTD